MTKETIISLLDIGIPVYWKTKAYQLIRDNKGRHLIHCLVTDTYQVLTDSYNLDDFFVGGEK